MNTNVVHSTPCFKLQPGYTEPFSHSYSYGKSMRLSIPVWFAMQVQECNRAEKKMFRQQKKNVAAMEQPRIISKLGGH